MSSHLLNLLQADGIFVRSIFLLEKFEIIQSYCGIQSYIQSNPPVLWCDSIVTGPLKMVCCINTNFRWQDFYFALC